ncbi:hypothetical protein B566_EDAN001059, partial [Ephemera danica]
NIDVPSVSNVTYYRSAKTNQTTLFLTPTKPRENTKAVVSVSEIQQSLPVSNDKDYQSTVANEVTNNPLLTPILPLANVKKNFELLKCELCDIIFVDIIMLANHIENCHETDAIIKVLKICDNLTLFQCVLCKTKFKELPQLIPHLSEQHKVIKLPHSCNSCNSKFILRSDLFKHRIYCKGNKIYDCYTGAVHTKIVQQNCVTSEIDTKEQEVKLKPEKYQLDGVHQSADGSRNGACSEVNDELTCLYSQMK